MKKKVLFIIGTLQSGGVSKSMVSLLNVWDRDKYETSLLLCCKEGDIFSKYLPEDVNVIYNPIIEHVMGGFSSAKWLFLHGHILLSIGVLFRLLLSRVSKALSGELIAMMMPIVSNEHYDLVVDYGGQQLLYYMVNKVKATRKVTFFHNDYSKWPYYYSADKKYYPKVDNIFSISKTCTDALKKYFPNCAEKVSIMENISSPDVIHSQATESTNELSEMLQGYKNEGNIILCTVAHFCRRKGGDFAVEAAEILKQQHVKFKWIFVGKILEEDLCDMIKKKRLDDNMIFVGVQSNPYPYMFLSDIYVQPSRYEGKSISLDEAKILYKPIVVTNFSTVYDQFENRKNATICEMSGESLSEAILELIQNNKICSLYSNYLRENLYDNSSEILKLYTLIS